jgi:hypothetical protein
VNELDLGDGGDVVVGPCLLLGSWNRVVRAEGGCQRRSVGASFDNGEITKSWAALTGWVTPSQVCGENSSCCTLPVPLLYGGPYVAVSLVPFSSIPAVPGSRLA